MKKINYLILLLLGVTLACVKVANTVSDSPEKIATADLTSPNGITIAESEKALINDLQKNVWRKSGVEENFDILEIAYLETKIETTAIITYKTISGFESNIVYVIFQAGEQNPRKQKIDCEANCDCMLLGSLENEAISYSCNCTGCVLIVEEIDS